MWFSRYRTTKWVNGGKYGASGLVAVAGVNTCRVCGVHVPTRHTGTDWVARRLVMWKSFGCGNLVNSTPGAANVAPVQL